VFFKSILVTVKGDKYDLYIYPPLSQCFIKINQMRNEKSTRPTPVGREKQADDFPIAVR
jgi:hypothetical protein